MKRYKDKALFETLNDFKQKKNLFTEYKSLYHSSSEELDFRNKQLRSYWDKALNQTILAVGYYPQVTNTKYGFNGLNIIKALYEVGVL